MMKEGAGGGGMEFTVKNKGKRGGKTNRVFLGVFLLL